MPFYFWTFLITIIAIVLYIKLKRDINTPDTSNNLPYIKKTTLMSEPERILFEKILKVIPQNYFVYPQYKLDKIFDIKNTKSNSEWHSYFNKINRKSVDFLVVNQLNQSPILAIELDDSSHYRSDRQERDGFVNQVCQSGQLPILHLQNCNIDETSLTQRISEKVNL